MPIILREASYKFFRRRNSLWIFYIPLQFIVVLVITLSLTRHILSPEGYQLVQNQFDVWLPFSIVACKFTDANPIREIITLLFGLTFEAALLNRQLLYLGFFWEGDLYEEG